MCDRTHCAMVELDPATSMSVTCPKKSAAAAGLTVDVRDWSIVARTCFSRESSASRMT
jgi:hypothetical protein